jgi:hypothetical protein
MADESRGRLTEKELRPAHQTQTESGEGDENLLEHNIDVQDFASPQRVDSNHNDRNFRNLSDETLTAMRTSALAHVKEKKQAETEESSASKHEPRLNSEKEGHEDEEEKRRRDEGFGQGSHGPVLRKPMLGERGHGPVVRGGRGGGRGRGGPGVSVMED